MSSDSMDSDAASSPPSSGRKAGRCRTCGESVYNLAYHQRAVHQMSTNIVYPDGRGKEETITRDPGDQRFHCSRCEFTSRIAQDLRDHARKKCTARAGPRKRFSRRKRRRVVREDDDNSAGTDSNADASQDVEDSIDGPDAPEDKAAQPTAESTSAQDGECSGAAVHPPLIIRMPTAFVPPSPTESPLLSRHGSTVPTPLSLGPLHAKMNSLKARITANASSPASASSSSRTPLSAEEPEIESILEPTRCAESSPASDAQDCTQSSEPPATSSASTSTPHTTPTSSPAVDAFLSSLSASAPPEHFAAAFMSLGYDTEEMLDTLACAKPYEGDWDALEQEVLIRKRFHAWWVLVKNGLRARAARIKAQTE